MNAAQPAPRWRLSARTGLVAAAVVGLLAVLYLFPPERSRFFPQCWFHAWTGWQCPGCGGLRAAHRLLHGDWPAAFRFNPFLVTALPLTLAWMAWRMYRLRSGRASALLPDNPHWLWLTLGAAAIFGVVRNLVG